jgi:cytochrome c-type biogenesis protein CcmH
MKLALFVGAAILLIFFNMTQAATLKVAELADELICQCGCTMVVGNCSCGTADQMRGVIGEKINAGMSKEQILAYFVSQYGERILAAPPKKGFNLTAWIVPFLALGGGGAMVYVLLSAWAIPSRREREEEEPDTSTSPVQDEYRERLEKELKDFD